MGHVLTASFFFPADGSADGPGLTDTCRRRKALHFMRLCIREMSRGRVLLKCRAWRVCEKKTELFKLRLVPCIRVVEYTGSVCFAITTHTFTSDPKSSSPLGVGRGVLWVDPGAPEKANGTTSRMQEPDPSASLQLCMLPGMIDPNDAALICLTSPH